MNQHFIQPEDIKTYGLLINSFSRVAKDLAKLLKEAGYEYAAIKNLVGVGPYNSLEDQPRSYSDFIHYGPYITEAPSGLFGAFASVHFPELSLAKQFPGLLGQRGFRLAYQDKKKQVFSWPLNEVGFSFIPQTVTSGSPRRETSGRITIAKELINGDLVIQEGTPVTKQGFRSTEAARSMRAEFSILDSIGNRVHDEVATAMLWLHLTAVTGLKKHGLGTAEFNTIAQDGPDDDFNAEREVVNVVAALKNDHHIDLMPEFDALTKRAGAVLNKKPKMLEAVALAEAICETISRGVAATKIISAYPMGHVRRSETISRQTDLLAELSRHNKPLKSLITILGLEIPTVPPDTNIIHDMHQFIKTLPDRIKAEDWYYHVEWVTRVQMGAVKRTPVFSQEWAHGKGNQSYTKTYVHPQIGRFEKEILEDALLQLEGKLRERNVIHAQKTLKEMEGALLRNECQFNGQQTTGKRVPHTNYHLSAMCQEARESLSRIREGIGQQPMPQAQYTHEVQCVEQVVTTLQERTRSERRSFLRNWELEQFSSFLAIMRNVDCNLHTLAELYGVTSSIRKSWGMESRTQAVHAKIKQAAVLQRG